MSKWINLNLPFNWYDREPENPLPPDLEERCKEVFGKSFREYQETVLKNDPNRFLGNLILDEHDKIRNGILAEMEKEGFSNLELKAEQAELDRRMRLSDNDSVKRIIAYRDFTTKYYEWYNKQPEVIAWNDECAQIRSRREAKEAEMSFCGKGLNKPGVQIEVKSTYENEKISRYLIGDMNTSGGVCDDCRAVNDDDIVLRYRVLCKPEEDGT